MRRKYVVTLLAVSLGISTAAAQPQRVRPTSPTILRRASVAEGAVKEAMEQLGQDKKVFERDLEVLEKLRAADEALIDDMQPAVAIQGARENVEAAKMRNPDFVVMQGIARVQQELDAAQRSPASADLGRLRGILRVHALGPASRVVAGQALRLEDEMLAWIKVQELIVMHQRSLSELAGESLRASVR